jgi:hypothetical protein
LSHLRWQHCHARRCCHRRLSCDELEWVYVACSGHLHPTNIEGTEVWRWRWRWHRGNGSWRDYGSTCRSLTRWPRQRWHRWHTAVYIAACLLLPCTADARKEGLSAGLGCSCCHGTRCCHTGRGGRRWKEIGEAQQSRIGRSSADGWLCCRKRCRSSKVNRCRSSHSGSGTAVKVSTSSKCTTSSGGSRSCMEDGCRCPQSCRWLLEQQDLRGKVRRNCLWRCDHRDSLQGRPIMDESIFHLKAPLLSQSVDSSPGCSRTTFDALCYLRGCLCWPR